MNPETFLTTASFIGASSYLSAVAIVFVPPAARRAKAAISSRLPIMKGKRVGGIRFLRIGRYQFSFCKCRR